jgi:small-conductance mechanosensitive channel
LERVFGTDLSTRLGNAERALFAVRDTLLDPWVLVQLGIVAGGLALGWLLGRRIESALEPRVRAVHGRPRLLRLLALLLRRTRWITAALLIGIAIIAVPGDNLPSRVAFATAAFYLIVAWVAISVVSRLVRNRPLARLLAWVAWTFVALEIVGAFEAITRALDSAAVHVGTTRISAWLVVQAIILVALLLWAAVTIGNFAERRLSQSADLTPSLRVLIGKLVKVFLVTVAGLAALALVGIDITALTFFSGALGLGIGFGLQKVVSNFVSGIIILLDKSIKPGDTIAIGDNFGWVRSLRARFVEVITRDGREYLVPNEDFVTNRVENWSFESTVIRFDVEFGVSYASDPHEVRRIAVEATKSVSRVEERPQPVCHLTKFNESSIDFLLRFWIADPQNGVTNVRGAVLLAVWDAFKAAGIEFPSPVREIVFREPIDLRVEAPPQP